MLLLLCCTKRTKYFGFLSGWVKNVWKSIGRILCLNCIVFLHLLLQRKWDILCEYAFPQFLQFYTCTKRKRCRATTTNGHKNAFGWNLFVIFNFHQLQQSTLIINHIQLATKKKINTFRQLSYADLCKNGMNVFCPDVHQSVTKKNYQNLFRNMIKQF